MVAINFLLSQKYWVSNHPNWRTPIFQRGGPTTNQPVSIQTWDAERLRSPEVSGATIGKPCPVPTNAVALEAAADVADEYFERHDLSGPRNGCHSLVVDQFAIDIYRKSPFKQLKVNFISHQLGYLFHDHVIMFAHYSDLVPLKRSQKTKVLPLILQQHAFWAHPKPGGEASDRSHAIDIWSSRDILAEWLSGQNSFIETSHKAAKHSAVQRWKNPDPPESLDFGQSVWPSVCRDLMLDPYPNQSYCWLSITWKSLEISIYIYIYLYLYLISNIYIYI